MVGADVVGIDGDVRVLLLLGVEVLDYSLAYEVAPLPASLAELPVRGAA